MAVVFEKPKALTDAVLHYCPGCTHGIIHRLVAEAIDGRVGYSVIANASHHLGDELRSRDSGRQLWRLCVILALLALAAETAVLKLPSKR